MKFRKMHGLGNDFVIIDMRDGAEALSSSVIKRICDRRRGVGCDQLILIEPSTKGDIFMRIYNPDGSESEACGNATRCVADIVMAESSVQSCVVQTLGGLLQCVQQGENRVRVNMGKPASIETLDLLGSPVHVNVGNPHTVYFVNDAKSTDVQGLGHKIEHHEMFPNRTNVEFAHINKDGSMRLRVWERGAGITQACGSGACATMIAAVEQGLVSETADVHMDGGTLSMEYTKGGDVFMTGDVAYVFEGDLAI